MDVNGNGVIDPEELYDPLNAALSPQNGYSNSGILTVTPLGGSGQYEYQYGSGLITNVGQIGSITYGAVTESNTYYVSSAPCTGGTHGYNARVVKVKVIDNVTGGIKEYLKYYNKTCAEPGGGGVKNPPVNEQDPHQ